MKKIRLVLADDHGLVRAGFSALLSANDDVDVVGEASDGIEALELVQEVKPDILLLDIAMPGRDGISVLKELHGHKRPHVVILTVYANEEYVVQSLRLGARGYMLKDCSLEELVLAIKNAHRGEISLSPAISRYLVNEYLQIRPSAKTGRPGNLLTEREFEVLKLIGSGSRYDQIATALYLSRRTVENHAYRIMKKLGLGGRADLIRYALRHRIADPDRF